MSLTQVPEVLKLVLFTILINNYLKLQIARFGNWLSRRNDRQHQFSIGLKLVPCILQVIYCLSPMLITYRLAINETASYLR